MFNMNPGSWPIWKSGCFLKKKEPMKKKKKKKKKELQYVSPILTSQIKQTTPSVKMSSLALRALPPPRARGSQRGQSGCLDAANGL